jgi:hypothetical protein
MPTAVERLLDSFLKLNNPREQGALNDAFVKIDDTLLNISSANTDDFLKLEHDSAIKSEFAVIGDAFIKLGSDFHKISAAGELIDQFTLKPTVGATNGGGGSGAQADFHVLDHKVNTTSDDLKVVGLDFLKLHTATSPDSFKLNLTGLSDDFLKLNGDMAADRDAFLKLSADFLNLGGDGSSPLDRAYVKFGGDLRLVADQFDTLANDFLNLVPAVQADGSVSIGDNAAGGGGGAGKVGATLALLYQDFYALGPTLNTIGGAATQLIGLLSHEQKVDGGPPTIVGGHGST